MGADITVSEQTALIRGKRRLNGTCVEAPDLRGGAGLIIAALAAKGKTEIYRINTKLSKQKLVNKKLPKFCFR